MLVISLHKLLDARNIKKDVGTIQDLQKASDLGHTLAVLSNIRIVIPEPRTGKVSTNSIDADKIVQLNKHASILIIPVLLEISNEAIKVIDPPSEETPKTCRAKIANEILELLEYVESDKGQYNVHPADIPSSREIASTTSIEAETNAYKDPKFTLGNTKSAARYD